VFSAACIQTPTTFADETISTRHQAALQRGARQGKFTPTPRHGRSKNQHRQIKQPMQGLELVNRDKKSGIKKRATVEELILVHHAPTQTGHRALV